MFFSWKRLPLRLLLEAVKSINLSGQNFMCLTKTFFNSTNIIFYANHSSIINADKSVYLLLKNYWTGDSSNEILQMQKYSLGIRFCYFFKRINQRNYEMINIFTTLNPKQKLFKWTLLLYYYKNDYF